MTTGTQLVAVIGSALLMLGAGVGPALGLPATYQQQAANAERAGKPPTILFICPHGAAKSVLASAYFQRVAKERGLNVRVESGGTEPDAQVAPAVAAHLTEQGYQVPITTPRQVTADQVASADVVISLGCDLTGLPTPRGQLQKWDEVPGPSENLAGADAAILKRVTDLVDELIGQSRQK